MDEQIALKAVLPEVVVVFLLYHYYVIPGKPMRVTTMSRLVTPDNYHGPVKVGRRWEVRVGVGVGWG